MHRQMGYACALLLLMPASAAAREPLRLEAASKWLLDYADERCSLVRDFGQGNQSVQLRIESFGSWRDFRITLVGQPVSRVGRSTDEIKFRFSPDRAERKTQAIFGSIGDQRALSFSAAFDSPEPNITGLSRAEQQSLAATPKSIDVQFERSVSSLTIAPGNARMVELALGSMADPLKAVRDCVDDLHASWGLDPLVQRNLSRLPVIRIETVRDLQRSYPSTMLQGGGTAFVPVRVMIDGQGRALSCVIQTAGVPKVFTDAVCDGLMGSYEPALDKGGSPVPTVYPTSVIYLFQG